jgi:hypothetical protein
MSLYFLDGMLNQKTGGGKKVKVNATVSIIR